MNNENLRKGGGRPKGVPNKATREIKEAARQLVESADYRQALQRRLVSGRAPHMETLLFHYAYGKPKETIDTPGLDNLADALSRKIVHNVSPGPSKAA